VYSIFACQALIKQLNYLFSKGIIKIFLSLYYLAHLTMTMVAVPAAAGVPCLRPLLLLLLFFNHHHLLLAVAQQQQQQQQQQQAVAAGYPGGGRGWRGMSEQERAGAFRANGYEWPRTFSTQTTKGWPPQPAGPESDAYRRSRERIEAHIRGIEDYKLRWDEFFGLAQVRLMPSFTEHGA
jgi:hypothetical protein